MNKEDKKMYIGALTGGGGALVLGVIFNTLLFPSWWSSVWALNLSLGLIGASLLIAAFIIRKKY